MISRWEKKNIFGSTGIYGTVVTDARVNEYWPILLSQQSLAIKWN